MSDIFDENRGEMIAVACAHCHIVLLLNELFMHDDKTCSKKWEPPKYPESKLSARAKKRTQPMGLSDHIVSNQGQSNEGDGNGDQWFKPHKSGLCVSILGWKHVQHN